MLLCATLCYSVLLCATLCYSVLLCATLCYSVLLCATLCYSVLLCATLCYSVLIRPKRSITLGVCVRGHCLPRIQITNKYNYYQVRVYTCAKFFRA
jgi:hypothetical protein